MLGIFFRKKRKEALTCHSCPTRCRRCVEGTKYDKGLRSLPTGVATEASEEPPSAFATATMFVARQRRARSRRRRGRSPHRVHRPWRPRRTPSRHRPTEHLYAGAKSPRCNGVFSSRQKCWPPPRVSASTSFRAALQRSSLHSTCRVRVPDPNEKQIKIQTTELDQSHNNATHDKLTQPLGTKGGHNTNNTHHTVCPPATSTTILEVTMMTMTARWCFFFFCD